VFLDRDGEGFGSLLHAATEAHELRPHELMRDASQRLEEKGGIERFKLMLVVIDRMLEEGPALVRGDSAEERMDCWRECVGYVELLWRASACLLRSGFHSTAAALSLTVIEEVGELAAERFRLAGEPHASS
jgi:hypothetical protein